MKSAKAMVNLCDFSTRLLGKSNCEGDNDQEHRKQWDYAENNRNQRVA